ncbi:hypothetical protein GGI12_003281 [Dipsacomyces acuminosporus]|nr:hypothetical protein GGI12_003281 [Dipsacomyces acuminosporus]
MSLKPFRIPETRLIVVSDLVVQVTLTFRTDEDEEVRYRYDQDAELQALVQTAVVSLVNCGYTNGFAKGPGFLLHQVRKKWLIGKRYIFTRDGEPLQSSLHKYFFQLELIDELGSPNAGPMLEISELRGIPMSPSASSYAGSTIEGLDAISLPPVSAIFGYGNHQQQQQQFVDMSPTLSQSAVSQNGQGSHRRAGSSSSFHRPPSPSPLRHSDDTASRMSRYSINSSSQQSLHHVNAGMPQPQPQLYEPRRSLNEQRPASISQYNLPSPQSTRSQQQDIRYQNPRSPSISSMRTRSISRSSIGSANGSVRTMQSQNEEPETKSKIQPNEDPAPKQAANGGQGRLGRTSWYRSLHGISPLSRQPKSISSDNGFVEGSLNAAAAAASADASINIPRIARPEASARSQATTAAATDPTETGLSGMAQRFKRKLLTPINLRRSRPRKSSLSHQMPITEVDSEADTSDFTGPESAGVSDAGEPEHVESKFPSLVAGKPRVSKAAAQKQAAGQRAAGSSTAATSNIKRPDMPPPSLRPPRPATKSRDEIASIPAAVKNALLRRLKSPLGGRPDKSSSRASVRDRIAAFNSLNMNKPDGAGGDAGSAAKGSTNGSASSNTDKATNGKTQGQLASAGPSQPTTPTTPKATVRKRLGTTSGFISITTPASSGARPQSRASSIRSINARPASPAMSQMSAVSSKVQEAINIFDSPASVTKRRDNGAAGVKRPGADPLEGVASPTKRPRAPSVAAHSVADSDHSMASATSSSRLNPLGIVQRMIQRHAQR